MSPPGSGLWHSSFSRVFSEKAIWVSTVRHSCLTTVSIRGAAASPDLFLERHEFCGPNGWIYAFHVLRKHTRTLVHRTNVVSIRVQYPGRLWKLKNHSIDPNPTLRRITWHLSTGDFNPHKTPLNSPLRFQHHCSYSHELLLVWYIVGG